MVDIPSIKQALDVQGPLACTSPSTRFVYLLNIQVCVLTHSLSFKLECDFHGADHRYVINRRYA